MRFFKLFLVAFLGWIGVVQAGEGLVYYVGVNQDAYRPFSWVENDELQGIDRRVLDAFALSEQVKLVYLPMQRLRAIELLKEDHIQLLYPDDYSWHSDAKKGLSLTYSEAAVKNEIGFFLHKRCDPNVEVKKVGALLGWVLPFYQQQIEEGTIEVLHFATIEQLLEASVQGEIDSIYSERQFLENYIASTAPRYDAIGFCEKLPSVIGDLRLSTLRHPELTERFNRFITGWSKEIRALNQLYNLPD